ncbi:TonB-dependent receptor [Massilia sp. TWR1-2-2]|uniref:TonB-dependent receptor n=1 Tax=Massilia sp. TWR1-2-2 TaxID=2804584 RepID=UPI003CF4DB37
MFKKSVLVQALSLAFATAALTAAVVQPAMAQSNASGTIFGKVDTAGATISIKNIDTNLLRKVTPDATGRYTATALPPGRYQVELLQGTSVVATSEVEVTIGQGAEASFSAAAVQKVQISGQRTRIDVSSANNGATFTARELARLPIAPTLDAIIQLAPNTTRPDYRYLGSSFGGSGPSENSYYINGFPVTNALTGLGSSELPFGAIAQAQILTGGFGAEFGRSIGGVVNITTKSGTNTWETGAMASITPKKLRSSYKDMYYAKTGASTNTATDGTIFQRRGDNTRQDTRVGAYVGGPIIQDKLFMFVALEQSQIEQSRVARNSAETAAALGKWGWGEVTDKNLRGLAKFDWNLTDAHRLELTYIHDDAKRDAYYYGYDYATRARGSVVNSGEHYRNDPANNTGVGSTTTLLKYTGNLTDALTLTTVIGQLKSPHTNTYDGYDVYNPATAIPQVASTPATRAPGLVYNNNQPIVGNILPKGAEDTVKSFRLDLEYKIGTHTIRVGGDQNKLDSVAGFFRAGGSSWTFQRQSNPTVAAPLVGSGPTPIAIANTGNGPLAAQGYWASQVVFNSGTTIASEQTSQYIEDRWQITPNLLLSLGLRDEQYKNINSEGDAFLDMKKQYAPRLGAVWDVNGDSSLKVFGTAGRYYLQVPTSISVRAPSRSINTTQAFTYTGVDANGAPTGVVALAAPFSANNEYNVAKDAKVLAAQGLKPNFQDEITLGFEKSFSPALNFGVKGTYRKLQSTLDDYCDPDVMKRWLAVNPTFSASKMRARGCTFINPGEDNTFLVDFFDADPLLARKTYTQVTFTKEMLGLPKAERNYAAVDIFAEHPLRGGWYGKVNYTWSRSKGNTEGQSRSDNGQNNPGATTTWDRPQLSEYANGLLPNDRTHQLKGYGFYEVTPQVMVGGNFLVASGRPLSCIGNHPTDTAYQSNYFYCDGKPVPRGSLGKLPTDVRLDLNLVYKPVQLNGFAFKVDVFNVTDRQTVQAINETYNSGTGVINAGYGRVASYSDPRSVRLTAEYNLKF